MILSVSQVTFEQNRGQNVLHINRGGDQKIFDLPSFFWPKVIEKSSNWPTQSVNWCQHFNTEKKTRMSLCAGRKTLFCNGYDSLLGSTVQFKHTWTQPWKTIPETHFSKGPNVFTVCFSYGSRASDTTLQRFPPRLDLTPFGPFMVL